MNVGRPTLLKDRALTQAEKTKRMYEKRLEKGEKSRRIFMTDKDVKESVNKFGGGISEALERAVKEALKAATNENGQLSLISNSQKMAEYDIEIKALKNKLKNITSIVGNYEKKAKKTRDWVQATKLINEVKSI